MSVNICHDALALTGESPFWDMSRGYLWWIDIQGQRLLRHSPENNFNKQYPLPSMPGFVALSEEKLIVGLEDGLWTFDIKTEKLNKLNHISHEFKNMRLNDGKSDKYGRLWFGTMNIYAEPGLGSLYCRDTRGNIHRILSEITIPNSICFSLDNKKIYFSDSPTQTLCSYTINNETLALENKKIIKTYLNDEHPDGACVDCEGGIWVAVIGGHRIERLNDDGEVTEYISLPVSRPTMPIFGGEKLNTLYITSQRRFLSIDKLSQEPLAGNLIKSNISRYKGNPQENLVKIQEGES